MKGNLRSAFNAGKELTGMIFSSSYRLAARFTKWLRSGKLKSPHFLIISSLALFLILGGHSYLQGYVYVVYVDDQEVGAAKNEKTIMSYLTEVTEKCAEIHGMDVQIEENISIAREYRPGNKPVSENIQESIRRRVNFKTEAFMVTVDNEPVAAVASEKDLEKLQNELKNIFAALDNGEESYSSEVRLINAFVNEELGITPCLVDPHEIYNPEVLAEKLAAKKLEKEKDQESLAGELLEGDDQVVLEGPYTDHYKEPGLLAGNSGAGINTFRSSMLETMQNVDVNVTIIEEVKVIEAIPFEVEKVKDDSMWVVESEVQTEGKEGKKEIVYYITRENGEEIDRTKAVETIIEEPVNQVELHGTVQVPAKGTGKFIWPVEGGGEVTPGRGFSSWHTGIDIDTCAGTNVLAADSGIVWFSGYGRTQGNYLILYHGSYWTLYLHNEVNLVSEGDKVAQGEVIARVGSTGRTTGAHLHFEIRRDDGTGEWLTYYQHEPIDPVRFIRP